MKPGAQAPGFFLRQGLLHLYGLSFELVGTVSAVMDLPVGNEEVTASRPTSIGSRFQRLFPLCPSFFSPAVEQGGCEAGVLKTTVEGPLRAVVALESNEIHVVMPTAWTIKRISAISIVEYFIHGVGFVSSRKAWGLRPATGAAYPDTVD